MGKRFTVDDIVEVTKAAYMTGVDVVWCNILFKGCKNPVKFHASPTSQEPFSREMYERLKSEQYGKLHHGLGEWYITQPKEQFEVEAEAIAKRNQLLLESDYTEFPSTQARLSDAQKSAWAKYRQDLRDITAQVGFPWDPEWPTKP